MMSENKGFVGGPQRKLQEKRRIRREEEIRKYKVLDVYDKQRTGNGYIKRGSAHCLF